MKPLFMMVFLLVIHTGTAWARGGDREGNGGDVVRCESGLELYDYYEARAQSQRNLEFGEKRSTWKEVFVTLLTRLNRNNKSRALLYSAWLRDFEDDAEFRSGIELIDIPDTGDGFVPKGCTLVQAAVQREPDFINSKRFTFDKDLWDQLSPENQAGLVLHEFILREAIVYRGHVNSRFTRFFNALIASTLMDQLNSRAYARLIANANFQVVDTEHASVWVGDLRVAEKNDEVSLAAFSSCATSYRPGGEFISTVEETYGDQVVVENGVIFDKDDQVLCGLLVPSNDPLSSVRLGRDLNFKAPATAYFGRGDGTIAYHRSGQLKQVTVELDGELNWELNLTGQTVRLRRDKEESAPEVRFEFGEGGELSRVVPLQNVTVESMR